MEQTFNEEHPGTTSAPPAGPAVETAVSPTVQSLTVCGTEELLALCLRVLNEREIPAELPAEWAQYPGVPDFHQAILELRRMILALAVGDLSPLVARRGFVAGALKALQSNLRHLTWQTKMIAEGDYTQRVAFMGDFSKSFNAMVTRLAEAHAKLAEQNQALSQEIAARQHLEIAEREQRLFVETLNQVGILLGSSLDFDNVLDRILEVIEKVVPYESAFLLLITDQQAQIVRQRQAGEPATGREAQVMQLSEENPLQIMRLTRQATILSDIAPAWNGQPFPALASMTSLLGAPIIIQDQVSGFLLLGSRHPHFFQRTHGERLTAFAVQAALALQNARLFEKVQRLATTDVLTGVYSRHQFFDLGQQAFNEAQRYQQPFSCIMMDLDLFKNVNDTFGHGAGDEVLCSVAQACAAHLRDADIFGRYGGEEFVLCLPHTDADDALRTAERLRQLVARLEIPVSGGHALRVTISLGVSTEFDGKEPGYDAIALADLIDQADQALYMAKQTGRNRSVHWHARTQIAVAVSR